MKRLAQILTILGSAAMLAGAVDPLEGLVLILPGSGLAALGAFLGQGERRLVIYRLVTFGMIGFGAGAMCLFSALGGIGGNSAHSMWWGLLMLPYFIGWSMGIWAPKSPPWVLWTGIGVGAWYLTLFGMILHSGRPRGVEFALPVMVIAAVGVLTIGGCVSRLRHRGPGGR